MTRRVYIVIFYVIGIDQNLTKKVGI